MPNLPKARRRPWKPKSEYKPQEGRLVTNKFYHSTAWRNFRAQQKEIAIKQAQQMLIRLIDAHETIPAAFDKLQPLCAECLKGSIFIKRKYTVATVLDHIKPINRHDPYATLRGHFGEPLSTKNTQWLCEAHHAAKSGKENKFHKNPSL